MLPNPEFVELYNSLEEMAPLDQHAYIQSLTVAYSGMTFEELGGHAFVLQTHSFAKTHPHIASQLNSSLLSFAKAEVPATIAQLLSECKPDEIAGSTFMTNVVIYIAFRGFFLHDPGMQAVYDSARATPQDDFHEILWMIRNEPPPPLPAFSNEQFSALLDQVAADYVAFHKLDETEQ